MTRSSPADRLRICLAAAPGGHLEELLRLRPAYEAFAHFLVTNRTGIRGDLPIARTYHVPDYGRGGRVRRTLALTTLFARSFLIYLRERPNVVLTTGPATGLPLALLVRLRGGLVIFIECSAQVVTPSRSGLQFRRIADHFFIQWPALRSHYPDAEYGGLLL